MTLLIKIRRLDGKEMIELLYCWGSIKTQYGGYGGGDGAYGGAAGYGAVGGRGGGVSSGIGVSGGSAVGVASGEQGGGGYMRSGYGDSNENAGFWRFDACSQSGA
ncbi:ctenidin-3-like [Amborella trichopoda]|uniref:ctenidin-3-like n=1 Tax=Amborella trichopoda TaxID=13333 RepID=UPI0005D34C33|nr:ctenidin-3-like [Amborella trichopoda]|eukprot:XP_011620944.1 ctenidin-3-like [Amborella trichopoda]